MRIGALTSLLLFAAIGAGGPGGPVGTCDFAQRAAFQLEQANAELAAGHAAESLAAAELGLEYAPDSRKLLEAAGRAAVAAGRRDDALFWSLELRERRADLDPLLATSKESRELYDRFESAAAAAAGLERRFAAEHLPANAADVARAARATRFSTEPPPARDAAKEGFANAREKQSRHFTVRSDVDGTTADEIADAMEAMHRVYRAIFRPRGEAKRVAIKAYRSREEFDAHEPGVQPEVHGFYSPQTSSIALYDPRHEGAGRAGRPFTAFWATLMHEAAHPCLHELGGKEPLPAWLNEGSACFFEGWRYARGGRVESGDVPRSRLRELIEILDTGRSDLGRPDLKSVLQWHEGGSLPASHYPVGWALVEFSFHFEDEAGDRPYFDAYRDLLDSWRNADDRRDGFARLVDCYVDQRKRAGVATFADFEQLWSRWMRGLAARTFGGTEQADAWLALARRQTEQRRFNAAAESLRSALDHRPGDSELLIELSGCALERNDKDGAILAARHALASAAGAVRESALALLTRADRRLAEEIVAVDDRLREATLATARGYAQAGLPRCALRRIDEATPLLLDDAELEPLRVELRKSGVEPGRWRRLAPDADAIEPAATRYVVEALIEPGAPGHEVAGDAAGGSTDRSAAAGDAYGAIVFGESERDGARLFGVSERRRLALLSARSTWEGTEEFTTAAAEGPVRLAVEVDLAHDGRAGRVICRLDGKEVRSDPLDVADFLPRAGVVAIGASIRITDARWRQ